MRAFVDVEQKRKKTYYARSRYGLSYIFGEERLVFNPTVKKGKGRNMKKLFLFIQDHTQ